MICRNFQNVVLCYQVTDNICYMKYVFVYVDLLYACTTHTILIFCVYVCVCVCM